MNEIIAAFMFHPLFITTYHFQECKGSELISTDIRQAAVYTLVRSPVDHRLVTICAHIHAYG